MKIKIIMYTRNLIMKKKLSKIEKEKEFHTFFNQREKSIITELFYSQLITTITCPCGYISYTFMKILDIPLLLNSNTVIHDPIREMFLQRKMKFFQIR